MTARIAVVVTEPKLAESLEVEIQACGQRAERFASVAEALEARPALVFVEWCEGGQLRVLLEGLHAAAAMAEPIPVLVLVAVGGVTAMRRARAEGAFDVLACPLHPQEIRAEIADLCADSGLTNRGERERFRQITRESLVGESPQFRKCLEDARLAARCDANVLLLGETGTGKEMVAQAIHQLSRRSGNPYVAVSCASLPAPLLESELFGHVKGAFTGADSARCGRFEAAGAGILLLDEIGDLDLSLQVKLLRVLEQRVFQRVGENTNVLFHARLVCATSVDLDAAANEGRFRRDLLGRIDQFRIALPPLRDRKIDIPILARHFLRKHAHGRLIEIGTSVMELLERYDFPMNVRQLENAIVGALARSDPQPIILPRHLPKEMTTAHERNVTDSDHVIRVPRGLSYQESRDHACRAVDRLYLAALLRRHAGNLTRAAEEAGIDRKTLSLRIREADDAASEKKE